MEQEAAVNGSGGEHIGTVLVDMNGAWTCAECRTSNVPSLFPPDASKSHCHECGAEAPSPVDGDAPPAEVVEQPAPVNAKPADVPLPLDEDGEHFERFNANKAMSAIIAKNIEVQASRDKYDSYKKLAADAKKELDQDEAALGRIITAFGKAREVQNSPQAMLPLNGQAPAVESNCPWERSNPGHACVVCREATRHKLNPDANSEVHPEHAGHEDVADKAHTEKVLKPLIPQLEAKGLHVELLDLLSLEGDELQPLLDWVEQAGIVPPAIVATSHVAAAPGSIAQVCANCGGLLADANDAEGFYPEGARVGLDCDSKIEEVVQAAEPVEAARTPKSHAKKAAGKKREPEKERAEQVAAGKKKAEPKKAKAAKKGRR